jgi:hypothetical protein
MDLTGKYLVTWMSDESLDKAYGRLPGRSAASGEWTVIGQVKGETHGVGVWVAIESVTSPTGERTEMETEAYRLPTLIRWEWIIGATASDTLPTSRPVRFSNRARKGG